MDHDARLLRWGSNRVGTLRALRSGAIAFGAMAIASATAILASRFLGSPLPTLPLVLAPFAFGLLLGLLVRAFGKPSDFVVAVELDRRLLLEETLATATWMRETPESAPGLRDAVLLEARKRSSTVTQGKVREALPLTVPKAAIVGSLVLAFALALQHFLPPKARTSKPAVESAPTAIEKKRVQEVAKKLDANAERLKTALSKKALAEAREAAKKTAELAKGLTRRPTSKSEALAKLSKVSEAALAAQRSALGASPSSNPLGVRSTVGELSKILGALAAADLPSLEASLNAENRAEEPNPGTGAKSGDEARSKELRERLQAAEIALEKLSDLLRDNPALRKKLEAQLKRLQKAIDQAHARMEPKNPEEGT